VGETPHDEGPGRPTGPFALRAR